MDKVFIFDTTLRDGEQTPGVALTPREKLKIAHALEHLGVDVIEAGFPASSPGDFEAVRTVATAMESVTVTALARAVSRDIETAGEALLGASHPRIHTFIASSPVHMKYKLKMSPSQVLDTAVKAVTFARSLVEEVEFSAEDASRTDPDFLCEIIEAALEAGATIINIPDTVGYTTPGEFDALIRRIMETVPTMKQFVLSVHCHNDLGLAVANSLIAVQAGARQVECAINGLGERAGNASLEEVVMAMQTRQDVLKVYTDVNSRDLLSTSRLVSRLTGIPIQPNKAIVGKNAFRHQAGIHQDGILKESTTYEIMTPESVGAEESELVLGKLSGRHAFRNRIEKLGFHLSQEQFEHCFGSFKTIAEKKKEVFDEDLALIVEEHTAKIPEVYSLEYIHTVTGNKVLPTATLRIRKGSILFQEAACGDGPIDATYKAIDRVCNFDGTLLDYVIQAATGGKDAMGEVLVRIKKNEKIVSGRGFSTDIIEASAKAYINAINRYLQRYGGQVSAPA